MDSSSIWGLRTIRCWRITLFLLLEVQEKPLYLWLLHCLMAKWESYRSQYKREWSLELCNLLLLTLCLEGFFIYRTLINSEKRFWESVWILVGGALWIFPVSVKDFAFKEGGSWFSWDKESVSRTISSTVRHRTNKRSRLTHLVGCFDDYCQVLELFLLWRRKKFQRDTSERSLGLING